jgi:hypothetical protein
MTVDAYTKTYTHPDKPGDRLLLDKGGTWFHATKGNFRTSSQLAHRGDDNASLRAHLEGGVNEWAGASDNALGTTGDKPTGEDLRNAEKAKRKAKSPLNGEPTVGKGGSGDSSGMGAGVRQEAWGDVKEPTFKQRLKKALPVALMHHALFAQGWNRENDMRKAGGSMPSTFSHPGGSCFVAMAVYNDGSWFHQSLTGKYTAGHSDWKTHGKGKGHESLTKYLGKLHGQERPVQTEELSHDQLDKLRKAVPTAHVAQVLHKHGWRQSQGAYDNGRTEFFYGDANQGDDYHNVMVGNDGSWMYGKMHRTGHHAFVGQKLGKGHNQLDQFLTKFHAARPKTEDQSNTPRSCISCGNSYVKGGVEPNKCWHCQSNRINIAMRSDDLLAHTYRTSENTDAIRAALPKAIMHRLLRDHGWTSSSLHDEWWHDNHLGNIIIHSNGWEHDEYEEHHDERGDNAGFISHGKGSSHVSLRNYLNKINSKTEANLRPGEQDQRPQHVAKAFDKGEVARIARKIRWALPQALAQRVLHKHGWQAPVGIDHSQLPYTQWWKPGTKPGTNRSIVVYSNGSWNHSSNDRGVKAKGSNHHDLDNYLRTNMTAEDLVEAGSGWRFLTEMSFSKEELQNSLSKLDVNTASRWIALAGGHQKLHSLVTKLASVYNIDIPDSAHETMKIASKGWRKARGSHLVKYYQRNEDLQMPMGRLRDRPSESPVGHLWGRAMLCPGCNDKMLKATNPSAGLKTVPIYKVNLGSYNQTCHGCGASINVGWKGWSELYDHPEHAPNKLKGLKPEDIEEGVWDRMKTAFAPRDPNEPDPDSIMARQNAIQGAMHRGQVVKGNFVRDQGLQTLAGVTLRTQKDMKTGHPLGVQTSQQPSRGAYKGGSGMGAGKRLTFVLPPISKAHHKDMSQWRRLQSKPHYIVNSGPRMVRLQSVDQQHNATLDREEWGTAHVMVHPGMGPDPRVAPPSMVKYTRKEKALRTKLGMSVEAILAGKFSIDEIIEYSLNATN